MKRVVVPAAAAILVLACAAAGVWIALVHAVAAAIPVQARLARDVLGSKATLSPSLATTLRQPGLHVMIVDRAAGTVIDAGSDGTAVLPLPGIGGGVGEPPPGVGGGGPLTGPPPPPPGAPGPPGGGPPGVPQAGPLGAFVLALAHVPPARIEQDDTTILISADARELGRWLALDVACFGLLALGIVGVAFARARARTRAERRALEARAQEREEAAERYKRFLAETGHELRTPLTVMAGYVEILRARNADEPLDVRILEGMHAETSRMRVLVEKMMTLARLESAVAVPRLLEIGVAAREAALTVQRRYPGRDVRVHAERPASIVIDADDYAAALGNILENAIKYAPDSPIVIETDVRDGRATTAVTDRGPGIREADRATIFERFQRGGGRAFGEGLGLGLAIVKRVADRWNGTVDCTSSAGHTVFRLSFPLADEEVYGIAR